MERADDDGDADHRRKDQSAGQSGVARAAEAGGLCALHQREQPDCDCRGQGQSARRGGRAAAGHDVCADARRSLCVQLERRCLPGARLPDGRRTRHRHGGLSDAGRAVRALPEGRQRRRGPDTGGRGNHPPAVLFEPEHLSAPLLSARCCEPDAGRHRPRAGQDSARYGDGHGQDLHRVPDRLPAAAQRHEKEDPVPRGPQHSGRSIHPAGLRAAGKDHSQNQCGQGRSQQHHVLRGVLLLISAARRGRRRGALFRAVSAGLLRPRDRR